MLIRVGGASFIPGILREFHLDPERIVRSARLDPRDLESADNFILYTRLGALVDVCTRETGCEHFGLLVGERCGGSYLGLLHAMTLSSPDLGAALGNLIRYFHHHDQAAFLRLDARGEEARLEYHMPARVAGRDGIGDGAIAVAYRLVKELAPTGWRPTRVLLPRRRPADIKPYTTLFNAPVEFGANPSALVFPSRWLKEPIHGASKDLRTLLEGHLDQKERLVGTSFSDQVRRVLFSAIGAADLSADKAAATLSVSRRTLTRRLRQENVTFPDVLDEVRFAIGRDLIESTDAPINEIAQQLGYSEPSAFIRAFRRWTGSTPNAWRIRSASIEQT